MSRHSCTEITLQLSHGKQSWGVFPAVQCLSPYPITLVLLGKKKVHNNILTLWLSFHFIKRIHSNQELKIPKHNDQQSLSRWLWMKTAEENRRPNLWNVPFTQYFIVSLFIFILTHPQSPRCRFHFWMSGHSQWFHTDIARVRGFQRSPSCCRRRPASPLHWRCSSGWRESRGPTHGRRWGLPLCPWGQPDFQASQGQKEPEHLHKDTRTTIRSHSLMKFDLIKNLFWFIVLIFYTLLYNYFIFIYILLYFNLFTSTRDLLKLFLSC